LLIFLHVPAFDVSFLEAQALLAHLDVDLDTVMALQGHHELALGFFFHLIYNRRRRTEDI
jgi:hypothetical protein